MKITDVKVIPVNQFLFVKIYLFYKGKKNFKMKRTKEE